MSLTSSPKSSRSISAVKSLLMPPSAGCSTVGASWRRGIATVFACKVCVCAERAAGLSIVGVSTVGASAAEYSAVALSPMLQSTV
jgi:hypothetical protein